MQSKLQVQWLIQDLFEVDAKSIQRKHQHAAKLGNVNAILTRLKDLQFQENISYQGISFLIDFEAHTVSNEGFPYEIKGSFIRKQFVNGQQRQSETFDFNASVNKKSISDSNPLGLYVSNFTLNQK